MLDKAFSKYLNSYAEPEVELLNGFPNLNYQNVLVIPAYREKIAFLKALIQAPPKSNFLLVLVSNHPVEIDGQRYSQSKDSHNQLAAFLDAPIWVNKHLSLHRTHSFDVLLVSRIDKKAIPNEEGVGLARKIGADLSLSLILSGNIDSSWIMSSDADTQLPENYFEITADKGVSALCYSFEHICDEGKELEQATKLYEKNIKYYADQLQKAGSNYGYNSLGSALAFDCRAYAQVRGFPKRAAGEDFYLLNKLAKIGKVLTLDTPKLKIQARRSSRVPFGTGPAVNKIMQSEDIYALPLFYSPLIFDQLKTVISIIKSARPFNLEELEVEPESMEVLIELGLETALSHAKKQKLTAKQYDDHMNSWLDGFRTLKYVHLMRDRFFPNVSHKQLWPDR